MNIANLGNVAAGVFLLGGFAITSLPATRAATPACDPGNGGLTLPAGFCALVVTEGIGGAARHLVVAPNGDVYVSTRNVRGTSGGIVGLRDTNGDGKANVTEKFGMNGATGIALRDGYLYYATTTSVERFKMTPGELKPAGPAEVVVGEFPSGGGHADKTFAFDGRGSMYVNVGLPSNACQNPDRTPKAPGMDPCPQLVERGGIWRFDEQTADQKYSVDKRYATGMRQPVALAWNAGHLFAVMNSRDSLDTLWPDPFTPEDNAERVTEPMFQVDEGANFGWPYCYHDFVQNKLVLAPEYCGDGKIVGRCEGMSPVLVPFPAHWAPVDLMFYTGTQFPQKYRGGAFIAFHGSHNRRPLEQAGYNITFQPFNGAKPSGKYEVFADGFRGDKPTMSPADATARPNGVAQGPDGSLYFTETVNGKVWRVIYAGK